MNNRIDIGIDVGWSECSRSCGVAVRGINPGWEGRHVVSYDNGIAIKLFTLRDLLEWLPTFVTMISDGIHRTTLVVDGPIGLNEPPRINRHVDSACRRNGFYGRAFPNDVTGVNGQKYVDTTYQIIDRFLTAGQTHPWLGQREPNGLIVAETHPTVGLSMLLPKLDPSTLPSRRRPFILVERGNRLVTAKSDWYWMRGAGRIVSEILGEPSIADDGHHERRATHFCLAIAVSLSRSNAIAIGRSNVDVDADRSGVYVLPKTIHRDWADEVNQVGITYGVPTPVHNVDLIDVPYSRRGLDEGEEGVGDPCPGDDPDNNDDLPFGQQLLCLCDLAAR